MTQPLLAVIPKDDGVADIHLPAIRGVQALQDIDERRFSHAVTTDDTHPLTAV